MAKDLPDPLARRDLLWGEQKRPVDHAAMAERYLEHARYSEAFDFVERVTDAERKDALRARIRDEALREGDYFLLNRVDLVAPVGEARWRDALRKAKDLGKLRYALRIARKLGDQPEVAALEQQLGIVTAVAPPPGVQAEPVEVPEAPAAPEPAPETAAPAAPSNDGDAPPPA